MDILFHPGPTGPIKPVDGSGESVPGSKPQREAGDFSAVLHEVYAGRPVRFSAHAARRLSSRGIEPGEDVIAKLHTAVDRADEKGSRESLVLIDKLAFIVAVQNRTVVTAMEVEQLKEDVVTNIDSAVIV